MQTLEQYLTPALAIRSRVRLESGRSDGRCGRVSEAIEAELGWSYRWGHLRLLDDGICWIHCWNQLPDGTIVDLTADQFEERWLGDMVALTPDDPHHACYRPAPPGHLFRTESNKDSLRLYVRQAGSGGEFEPDELERTVVPDTPEAWSSLGARAIEIHSGWRLPEQIASEAGHLLRDAALAAESLHSRAMEFALDEADRRRRAARCGEWTSPEWREMQSNMKRR